MQMLADFQCAGTVTHINRRVRPVPSSKRLGAVSSASDIIVVKTRLHNQQCEVLDFAMTAFPSCGRILPRVQVRIKPKLGRIRAAVKFTLYAAWQAEMAVTRRSGLLSDPEAWLACDRCYTDCTRAKLLRPTRNYINIFAERGDSFMQAVNERNHTPVKPNPLSTGQGFA